MLTIKCETDENGCLETLEVDGKLVPKEVLEVFRKRKIRLPEEISLAGLVKFAKATIDKPKFRRVLLNSFRFRKLTRKFLWKNLALNV